MTNQTKSNLSDIAIIVMALLVVVGLVRLWVG